jgi:hypothetical protein
VHIGSATFSWTPTAADVGTRRYIGAMTTNTRTDVARVRYDYYLTPIIVEAAPTQSTLAALTGPANGSTFPGPSVPFTWTPGIGARQYWLTVGTTQGGREFYDQGQGLNTSVTVPNLPVDGRTLYVRLWTEIGASGNWFSHDYTYTAAGGGGGYVVQGGLTWTPATIDTDLWPSANSYCTGTTINGQTGWRLPTVNELVSLANSGALDVGWYVWSSTPYPTGGYYVVFLDPTRLFNGTTDVGQGFNYVSCVHPGNVPTPTGISATAGNGQVTISWNAVIEAASYNLYRASISGITKSNYSSLPDGVKVTGVTSPYIQTSLANSTTYYFVVTAVNANGESNESSEVSATPQFRPLPPGYVVQGGLNWMPVTFNLNWPNANAFCTNTTINGQTGWRLPTKAEANAFAESFYPIGGFRKPPEWTSDSYPYIWTSTPSSVGYHWFEDITQEGIGFEILDANQVGVTCIH